MVNGKDQVLGLLPSAGTTGSSVPGIPDASAYQNSIWSLNNADALDQLLLNPTTDPAYQGKSTSNGMGNNAQNQQNQALLDFLAVYATTQSNGYWDSINLQNNSDAVRQALFGSGTQSGGLVDASNVLVGGTSDTLGSALTAKSLADFMGNSGVDYSQWVEPLQAAMAAFDINTPERIAAFLAQVKQETGRLGSLKENVGQLYQVTTVLNKFVTPFGGKDSTPEQRFNNLKDFVKNDLKSNQLDNVKWSDFTVDKNGTVQYAHAGSKIYLTDSSEWTSKIDVNVDGQTVQEERYNVFYDYVYSQDNGNGQPGDGTYAQHTAHKWVGRGTLQITHQATYKAFADYIQANYPSLVTPDSGKTVAETLLAKPDLISEKSANGRMLSALAGAWYWNTKNANNLADKLTWENPAPKTDKSAFAKISQGVGAADPVPRWQNYQADVTSALKDANPYDDMRAVMASLGLSTQGATGYQSKFGLTLRPTLTRIGGNAAPVAGMTSHAVPQATSDANTASSLLTVPPLAQSITSTTTEDNAMATSTSTWLSSLALGAAVSTTAVATAQATPVHAMGACQVAQVRSDGTVAEIAPTSDADTYTLEYLSKADSPLKKYSTDKYSFYKAATKILASPKHGKLTSSGDSSDIFRYTYLADKGFSGDDAFVIQVEKYGLKIQVHYTIKVPIPGVVPDSCNSEEWKISQIDVVGADGTQLASTVYTPENPFQGTLPSQPGQPSPGLPLDLSLLTLALRRKSGIDANGLGLKTDALAASPDADATTTLTNTDFNGTAGWTTTGHVTMGSGAAELDESATTQTRLDQVFTLGANDQVLRFTVSDVNLQSPGNGPQDAFEVALLDAATGQSEEGPIALSNTDDFLNLQGDGASFLADGVTFTTNADGSRTYRVDLRQIAPGTTVNLSFDLIGFGVSGSHVTVRDLYLGSDVPQTQDDAVTTAEDTPVVIDALSNDTATDQPGFVPVVVTGPAHGQVVVNDDGSFGYTPDRDYNGADSFTYKLSNGSLDSNVSTVNLTLTPVNDAPVANDVALATREDTPQLIDLLAQVHDVDSPTLTPHIVAGPAHGQLALNDDGTYTYTPDANFNGADSFSYLVNDGELDSAVATVQIAVSSVNDAPTGTSTTVTTLEDTPYVFNIGDFGFADAGDAPANVFAAVIVNDLPLAGSLTLGGQAVAAGQRIATADIAAGQLQFLAAPNANGNAYASFTFQVQDDGGTANGGADTDAAAKALTLDVTPVNDAPTGTSTTVTTLEDTPYVFNVADFGFADAGDAPANAFAAVIVNDLPLAGSLTLDGQAVAAGQRIATADIAAGQLQFLAAPNANGNAYASFTFQVQDDGGTANGGVDTDTTARTLTLDVTPVNDAPVAAPAEVSGTEDTAYVFGWKDFPVSDIDSTSLSIVIATLPDDGQLQSFDGTAWTAVTANQALSATDIAAGHLRFVPAANASGFGGFTTAGTGNLKQHYARFDYRAFDGELSSDVASLFVDITPVADAPTLTLVDRPGDTQAIFRTTWEDVCDYDGTSTLVHASTLDGWNLVRRPDATWGGLDGFEIWSEGDRMAGPNGRLQTVHAAADGGRNWLELNDAQGVGAQTLGIERSVDTVAGATYTLSLDYAGRIGYSADTTAIGIYVDGVEIARYAGTSPADALDWQALSFSFIGTGGTQTLRIVTEATQHDPQGRGAMIDTIALTEALPANTGNEDTAIPLSAIQAALADTDGSEVLGVALSALPAGATLSDGTHSFTATAEASSVDITGWNRAALTLLPPADFNGTIALTVEATSTETSNGDAARTTATLTVTVLPVDDAPVAQADSATVREAKTVVIDVLANDSGVDSASLEAQLVSGPRHGQLTRNADGTFSYTADCGFVGTDTFTYRASDGTLASNLAIVTITVTADHAPVAQDDAVSTPEGTPVRLDLLANDTDADGDPLTARLVCGPGHGTLARHADGSYTYTPNRGWYGTDSVTYRANDGQRDSNLATVRIAVTHVNHAPTAQDATFPVPRNGSVRIDFGGLVGDADGDRLVLRLDAPAHGTLTRQWDGSYLYCAPPHYTGSDAFTYTVSDGTASATATIRLNIGANAGCSVSVQSGWPSPRAATTPVVSYLILGANGASYVGSSTPVVAWDTPATVLDDLSIAQDAWLLELFGDDRSAADLAEQTGLVIRVQ